jgi:hypothetical protein
MKNIHVLPTNKPSRLISCGKEFTLLKKVTVDKRCKHIYITNDEVIKEGDWMIRGNEQPTLVTPNFFWDFGVRYYKIILTTDQDLINDGVQSINDEFLEWFINNPSCEYVPIITTTVLNNSVYKTNIGFETWRKEAIQETLEEAIDKILDENYAYIDDGGDQVYYYTQAKQCIMDFIKWQAERMYSEEEVLEILNKRVFDLKHKKDIKTNKEWFEQFKKNK